MAGFRSSNGYLGFERQIDQTTDTAPTTFLRLAAADSLEQVQDVIEDRTLNSDREIDAIYKVAHKPGGSFQTYARPGLGAQLLAYALGADSVTVGSVYTHTITRANTIPWLTIERQLDNIERFIGCKINQIVISGNSGQPVLMDISFMACDSEIQSSAASASYQTDEPFMFHDGTYTLDSGAITTISAFTITINNNLELIQTTSFKPNDILEGPFDVESTMRLKFVSGDALYPKVLFGASTALVDTLASGDFTIDLSYGTGASARELRFEIPALKHLSIAKHLDPVTKAVYLDLRSKPVKSTSEIITVIAKNSISEDWVSPSATPSPSSSVSPSKSPSASASPSLSPSASLSPSSSASPSGEG